MHECPESEMRSPEARIVIALPYLFDRIHVRSDQGDFCFVGAFLCQYASGPNLQVLADKACELQGNGFYGLVGSRYLGFQRDRRADETFDLSYTGNGGLYVDSESLTHNREGLAAHITWLEERGAHGITARNSEGVCIYADGGFLSQEPLDMAMGG